MAEASQRLRSEISKWQRYYIAFSTIVIKEFNRFIRIWVQTILPPAITMGLYFVIFGNLIGPRIGRMGGFTYMQYIAPGIIMMAIITNAYSNVVSSFFGAKFQRHIEEILIAPVPSVLIVSGYVCGGVCRGIMVGALVTVVALFFTDLQLHSWFITIAVAILTSALFSLGGFINAIFARKFDDISIVPTFILTPLTYLGGVFYSIDLLPDPWRQVSLINPILYMVNAFRYGILGVSDIDLFAAFSVIIGFVLMLGTVSVRLLDRGVGIRT
jgi:ABC-2 type transport system permease protein